MSFVTFTSMSTIGSMVAAAYQSYTSVAYAPWPSNAIDYSVHLRAGTVTGTGQVDVQLDHCAENPEQVSPIDYKPLCSLTGALTTTSTVATWLENPAVNKKSLLPYARLTITAKSTAAGTYTVNNVVRKLLAVIK